MKILGVFFERIVDHVYIKGTGYFTISSMWTEDYGFETVVCQCNSDLEQFGDEVYTRWYDDRQEMLEGHRELRDNIMDYII